MFARNALISSLVFVVVADFCVNLVRFCVVVVVAVDDVVLCVAECVCVSDVCAIVFVNRQHVNVCALELLLFQPYGFDGMMKKASQHHLIWMTNKPFSIRDATE